VTPCPGHTAQQQPSMFLHTFRLILKYVVSKHSALGQGGEQGLLVQNAGGCPRAAPVRPRPYKCGQLPASHNFAQVPMYGYTLRSPYYPVYSGTQAGMTLLCKRVCFGESEGVVTSSVPGPLDFPSGFGSVIECKPVSSGQQQRTCDLSFLVYLPPPGSPS